MTKRGVKDWETGSSAESDLDKKRASTRDLARVLNRALLTLKRATSQLTRSVCPSSTLTGLDRAFRLTLDESAAAWRNCASAACSAERNC